MFQLLTKEPNSRCLLIWYELAHQAKSCVFHNWDIQERKKNLRAHFQFWIFDMQANMKFLKFETQGKNLWVTVLSTLNQMLTFNIWQWGQILNFNYLACRMKSCINFKNELWSGLTTVLTRMFLSEPRESVSSVEICAV